MSKGKGYEPSGAELLVALCEELLRFAPEDRERAAQAALIFCGAKRPEPQEEHGRHDGTRNDLREEAGK